MLELAELENVPQLEVVGKKLARVDAKAKVTGRTQYAFDIRLPRMLVGKILRSPFPYAKIASIRIERATTYPGVKGIATATDPALANKYGGRVRDRFLFARDVVRYVGEPVAAVAAETENAAREALALIDVQYDELPAVFDAEEAMKSNAPLLHPDRQGECSEVIPVRNIGISNVSAYFITKRGDVESGLKRAHQVIENRFTTQMAQHVEMEPPVSVAQVGSDGRINVWTSTQAPYRVLEELVQSFGLPPSRFRIIAPCSGGGFGNKLTMHAEGAAVALALKTMRPVRVALSREETLTTTTVKHPFIMYIRDGVSRSGKLLARDMRVILNGGAYAGSGVMVCKNCAFGAIATYNIEHLKFESIRIYTNQVPGGAFRGFGCEATIWAIETQMDEIAEKLGIDRAELRLKNLRQEGEPNLLGEPMPKNGMSECFARILEDIKTGITSPPAKGWVRGIGYALGDKYGSGPTAASAEAKIYKDGTVEVRTSATEIGGGTLTALTQIAAEELGANADQVIVTMPDTAFTPFDEGALSSRQTYCTGNAVRFACQDAKRQLLSKAAKTLGELQSDLSLSLKDTLIRSRGSSKQVKLSDLFTPMTWTSGSFIEGDAEVFGKGACYTRVSSLDPITGQTDGGKINVFYTPVAAAAIVDVDRETGQVKVVKLSCAVDAGRAINPLTVEGQIEGGLIMGTGAALYEELVSLDGRIHTTSFLEYQVPRAPDLPNSGNVSTTIVEVPEPKGPFGARGVGEASITVVGAAITNAVSQATGKRIRSLPLKPESIWRAQMDKN